MITAALRPPRRQLFLKTKLGKRLRITKVCLCLQLKVVTRSLLLLPHSPARQPKTLYDSTRLTCRMWQQLKTMKRFR